MTKWLTKKEVADMLSMSPRSIDRLRAMKKLCAVKIGNSVRFRPEEIDGFALKNRERR